MKKLLVLWTLAATVCANNQDENFGYEYDQGSDYDHNSYGTTQHDDDPPTFTASAQHFSVEIKDDITFSCDVKNIHSHTLMFLHILPRGEHRTLFVGDHSVAHKGYKLKKNGNSFILSGIARRHAGKYQCRIETLPVTRLTHVLDVQYPAKAERISPEVQRVEKGSSVTLECKGHGNPKAAISWSRQQGHLPSGAKAEERMFPIHHRRKPAHHYGNYYARFMATHRRIRRDVDYQWNTGTVSTSHSNTGMDSTSHSNTEMDPTSNSNTGKASSSQTSSTDKQHGTEGSSLTFPSVDRHVEGVYICTAANGIGDPSSTEMRIEVDYPPEIITEQATLHTDEGDQAKLLCIVHGRPAPVVEWTKDGEPLSPTTHIQEHDGTHRHTLTIAKITTDDFGNYSCSASNNYGQQNRILKITGVPKSPTITSSPAGGERFVYTITWDTESYQPIIQYDLTYRKIKDSENVIHPKKGWIPNLYSPPTAPGALQIPKGSPGPWRSMSQTLEGLEPATDYEIVVSVENKFGWSDRSEVFAFHTRKELAVGQSASGCSMMIPSATLVMSSLWAYSHFS